MVTNSVHERRDLLDTLTPTTLAELLQEPEKGGREPFGQHCRWSKTTAATIRAGAWQDLKAPRDRAWTAPVTVISTLACLLFVVIGMTGCAPIPALPFDLPSGPSGAGPTSVLTLTEVHLRQRNYRVIRENVTGTSRGFALLGLLMLKPPDAAEAFASLYEEGDLRVLIAEGRALAFVNVMQASSAPYFLLFSLPKITFRADVVEFVEP
jgi:hypothetical protein